MALSAILSNKICNQIGYSPYWQLLLNGNDNYRETSPLLPLPRWPCGSARCGRVAEPLATPSSGPRYSCTSQTWRARMASALQPQRPDRNFRFSHEITKFGLRPPSSNLVPRSPRFVFLSNSSSCPNLQVQVSCLSIRHCRATAEVLSAKELPNKFKLFQICKEYHPISSYL